MSTCCEFLSFSYLSKYLMFSDRLWISCTVHTIHYFACNWLSFPLVCSLSNLIFPCSSLPVYVAYPSSLPLYLLVVVSVVMCDPCQSVCGYCYFVVVVVVVFVVVSFVSPVYLFLCPCVRGFVICHTCSSVSLPPVHIICLTFGMCFSCLLV